jgi:hypothetical protein
MASDDRDRIELGLLIDEYRALKAEIVSNLNSGRQIASIAIAGVGALVAAGRFLVESGRTDLLLIVPMFFYALAWAQLRYVYLVLDMGAYLRKVVAPRVRLVLARIPSDQREDLSHILSWEDRGKSVIRKRTIVFIPIAGANFAIPLLAAVASVIAHFVFRSSAGISLSEALLLVLNALAFLYSAYWGGRAETDR